MSAVHIITDSTSDLGDEARKLQVSVIPMTVSFGADTYQDGVTIDPQTFYERLATSRDLPVTSQPSPQMIENTIRAALQHNPPGIVVIAVSSRLSGTYSTTCQVARQLKADGVTTPIEVIDSMQGSIGMHYGILAAVRAANEQADLQTVVAAARDALARTSLFLIADDLDYLQRGGRIGQAQRLVGSLLQVKPLITLRDGAVVALESPRTRRRAYERAAECMEELAPLEAVTIGQSGPELGDQLEAEVRRFFPGPFRRMWAGPTIGTHVGPGAAGIAVLRASRPEIPK